MKEVMKNNETFSSRNDFLNSQIISKNKLKPFNILIIKTKIFLITLIILFFIFIGNKIIHINKNKEIHFKYEDYEKDIINNKIKRYSKWQLSMEQANFINGIIRKKKLKKCLEIGVANGGSSVLILNSIKNIKNSFLVSLDLNTQNYKNSTIKTGYIVNKYFPELKKKWKLLTGDQPHKFLVKLILNLIFYF